MAKQKRSCDGCHKRKIQCVISAPGAPCDWCSYHNLACTFDRVRGRRKRLKSLTSAGAGLKKDLDERIVQIEHALSRYHPLGDHHHRHGDDAASPPPPPTPSSSKSGHSHPTNNSNQSINPFTSLGTLNTAASIMSTSPVVTSAPQTAFSPQSPVNILTPQTIPTPCSGCGNQMSPAATWTHMGTAPVPALSSSSLPSPPPPGHTYKRPHRSQGNVALGQLYSQGQNLGTLCARDGVPSFTPEARQWIVAMTGQCPCFKTIDFEDPEDAATRAGGGGRSYMTLLERSRPASLPDRWIVDTFLSEFLRSDLSLIFPIVDNVLFPETIETAYEVFSDPPTLRQLSARACVFAFLAYASSHFSNLRVAYLVDGDQCISEAKILLLCDTVEDSSLETLQTIIMMILYETHHGRLQSVAMFHSTACRAVLTLGAHTISPSVPRDREVTRQEREDFQLRNLFWLCYKLDKDIAIRTGQPPLINDDFCDLTLPDGYVESRFAMPRAEPDNSPLSDGCCRIPRLPGDLRLDMMNSKVFKLLYSMESCRKSDTELLRAIRELDEELENWRETVPAAYAPSLSVNKAQLQEGGRHGSNCMNMLQIELQVQYHYLMTIIHSASGRCSLPPSGAGEEQAFGVQSSLDLSVEASRSTLIFLKATVHRMAGEAFWAFVSYPVSALLTLFFNILRDPCKDQAMHDVELLRSAADLIRRMPMKKVTAYEETYLRKVDGVIVELARLGRCAIEKARGPYLTP